MKEIIQKKYDLHFLRGFGLGGLVYFTSLYAGLRELIAVFLVLVASFLWNGFKFYVLKKSSDNKDMIADFYGGVLAVIVWVIAVDYDLKKFISWYVLILATTLWFLRFPQLRKFWIKYFVLNYLKPFTFLRAAAITFPLVVLNGLWVAVDEFNPYLFFPLLITFYFGFVYFKGLPVEFKELDESQKFQFGFFPRANLTTEEWKEWQAIVDKFNKN